MDEALWWQRGVIYHIYPRSFQDTNGDGIGDLLGITRRLPYLADLGIDAIWISPIYPSPLADFGYDVSDYTAISPEFGTLADFDALVREAHARDIRVLLDWVPNHTSDRHPWFIESRASRQSPKRDWYLWHDPRPDGGPPNGWISNFGGSAWQWDELTGQYYAHAYLPQQPDLNWRNPEVREAMYGTLRFWLDRGIDGFRIDALRQIVKDAQLHENPPNPDWHAGMSEYESQLPFYTTDQPEVQEIIREVRQVVEAYGERMLIGELYLPIERLMVYYGENGSGIHLPTNFHLLTTPWRADALATLIDTYEAALPAYGWPDWVLGNHDKPRVASRIGLAQAPVAAMLLLTLRGTPTMYYGDELGMRDVPIPPDRLHDPVALRGASAGSGRDPERTPMQWDSSPSAGFTSGTPWLPLAADATTTANVAAQLADPDSLLQLYRRLLALRRREPTLTIGAYRGLGASGDVLAYVREYGERRLLVVLNTGSERAHFDVPHAHGAGGSVVLSTHLGREGEDVGASVEVAGNEGVIVALS